MKCLSVLVPQQNPMAHSTISDSQTKDSYSFYWFKKYRAISIGWFKNKWLLWTDSLKDFFKNLTNSGTRLKQSNEFLTVWSKYIIQSVYLSIMSQFFLVNQKHIESESKTNVSYELIQKPDRINLLNHFITSIRLINT